MSHLPNIRMQRRDRQFDWRQFGGGPPDAEGIVDPRRRLRRMAVGFGLLAAVVLARIVTLEISYGAAYREEATRHLVKRQSIPGVRGRILARDGTVLAYDKHSAALAMHYRYFEQPANPRWLRREARARLPRSARGSAAAIAAEEARVLNDRDEMLRDLAALCGETVAEFQTRAAERQARVRAISDRVNRRRQEAAADAASTPQNVADDKTANGWVRLGWKATGILFPPRSSRPPAPVVVAEELDYHVLADDVPLEVVAEIEAHPQRYPGVRIVERSRRVYPSGMLAAHVLGHLGAADDQNQPRANDGDAASIADGIEKSAGTDTIGRMGVERCFETTLRGADGWSVAETDRGGRVLATHREREPAVGRDLVLTFDLPLQRTAESLLDAALAGAESPHESAQPRPMVLPTGGAIVIMDVHSGALLTAASAPRFDPNVFSRGDDAALAGLLDDSRRPLFDRVARMAIPPGSVFKIVTATALMKCDAVKPETPFYCQGYLSQPDRQRCQIFRHLGLGHGETNLQDALVRSCNTYFFHFAAEAGPTPLVDWAQRFGFGRKTGVDLPDEVAGRLPTPGNIRDLLGRAWRPVDTQALAIGQSALEATPLQVARLLAAVANGGRLVTPHVGGGLGLEASQDSNAETNDGPMTPSGMPHSSLVAGDLPPVAASKPVEGLDIQTLRALRESLKRVVADPEGTAHDSVFLESVSIAGKTGTAETGRNRADHAWFAGYVPADSPRVAVVVVLTHAGNGADRAGPIARQLVERMQSLGYFGRPRDVVGNR